MYFKLYASKILVAWWVVGIRTFLAEMERNQVVSENQAGKEAELKIEAAPKDTWLATGMG